MSVISTIFHTISDHGNILVSKLITWMGVSAGIVGGGALGVSNNTANKIVESIPLGWPDYAAMVAVVSGVCLAIKTIVDTYYKIKNERRKDQNNQQ